MKKTYIEPKNTVVELNVRESVLQASITEVSGITGLQKGEELSSGTYDSDSRDVINTPDAWEEW